MKLTPEEKQMLNANLVRINGFIQSKIIPNLDETAVSIPFGEITTFANGTRGHKYTLHVSKHGVTGSAGYLSMSLLPCADNPGGASILSYSDAGIDLLQAWPAVKQKLLAHVESIKEKRDALYNFAI